jgi:hypothetical protein
MFRALALMFRGEDPKSKQALNHLDEVNVYNKGIRRN